MTNFLGTFFDLNFEFQKFFYQEFSKKKSHDLEFFLPKDYNLLKWQLFYFNDFFTYITNSEACHTPFCSQLSRLSDDASYFPVSCTQIEIITNMCVPLLSDRSLILQQRRTLSRSPLHEAVEIFSVAE